MIFEKDYNMHVVFLKSATKCKNLQKKKKRKTNKTPANLSLKCLKGKKYMYYIIVKTLARI